ncbi:MAG: Bifunctional phosphoglucose/phosphomannose isomerase, partial [bacterium 42_11]
NSKQPAYACNFPELDHNEIVGWMTDNFKNVFKIVALRHSKEYGRTSLRFGITRDLISNSIGGWREVEGRGQREMAILYSLIYFGDFVSLYLAYLNGVDPTPVSIITKLKNEMSKSI